MRPLAVVKRASRRLVIEEEIAGIEPRVGNHIAHDRAVGRQWLRRRRYGDLAIFIEKQPHAEARIAGVRDGGIYGVRNARCIKREGKIAGRVFEPLHMTVAQPNAVGAVVQHRLDQFELPHGVRQEFHFEQAFGVFLAADGIGDDAGSNTHLARAGAIDDGCPDRDVEQHFAIRRKVTDSAAVDAARVRFESADKLHRPDFWRAGDRARREDRAQHVVDRDVVLQDRPHARRHLMQRLERLDREEVGHAD